MKGEEIVNFFLNHGYLLEPQVLKELEEDEKLLEEIVKIIEEQKLKQNIISKEFLDTVIRKNFPKIEDVIKSRKGEKITIEELTTTFSKRYETIKNFFNFFFLPKLISISRLNPKLKNFSLIGMVFEKNDEEKSIILEDETGQTKVYFEDDEQFEEIILDDVVGVVCEKRGEKDFVKEIVWPYVASKREVVKDKGKCIFISDFSLDKKSSEIIYKKFLDWIYKNKQEKFYIFVLGNISKDEKKLKDFFDSIPNNFFKIFISSKTDAKADVDIYASRIASITIGKVSFLLSSGDTLTPYVKLWKNSTPEKIMLKILKRRYINVDGESFIIKNFPDIFAAGNFGNVGMMNYKGTTILSTGDSLLQPIYWLIDLASRETLKIDFS